MPTRRIPIAANNDLYDTPQILGSNWMFLYMGFSFRLDIFILHHPCSNLPQDEAYNPFDQGCDGARIPVGKFVGAATDTDQPYQSPITPATWEPIDETWAVAFPKSTCAARSIANNVIAVENIRNLFFIFIPHRLPGVFSTRYNRLQLQLESQPQC
jgi:hypothetical protein